jgi:glycosyltransferase involved in cell wall biosynthesis
VRDGPGRRVDVIVAVRDGARTIEDCVRSVLEVAGVAQVVVVDDGSTDATPEILAGIQDPRLRVERVEHHSRARAANHALRLCTAPFVCSIDADVRIVRDRFDELTDLAGSVPFLLLTEEGSSAEVTRVGLTEQEFRPPRDMFLFSRLVLPDLRFAEVYRGAGGEDTDLALRLLKAGVRMAVTSGGHRHARDAGPMGWRRRAHFHLWNLVTYGRHLDVPFVRHRLVAISRSPVRRAVASIRQERHRPDQSSTVR